VYNRFHYDIVTFRLILLDVLMHSKYGHLSCFFSLSLSHHDFAIGCIFYILDGPSNMTRLDNDSCLHTQYFDFFLVEFQYSRTKVKESFSMIPALRWTKAFPCWNLLITKDLDPVCFSFVSDLPPTESTDFGTKLSRSPPQLSDLFRLEEYCFFMKRAWKNAACLCITENARDLEK